MDKTKELEKKANKLKDELAPIQEQLREIYEKEEKEERKKLIGKCYLYRNSVGAGEEWDLFIKIIGVTKSGLKLIKAEDTCYGIKIETENRFGENVDGTEISNERFMEEFNLILKELKP